VEEGDGGGEGETCSEGTTKEEEEEEEAASKGRRVRNATSRANYGCNTKFRIIPRTPQRPRPLPTLLLLPPWKRQRRNGNITTITIKMREERAGVRARALSRRWRKRKRTERPSHERNAGARVRGKGCRKQALEEFSSSRHRLMVYCPSMPEDPRGGKETSAQMFLPRYFPGQERTKFPPPAAQFRLTVFHLLYDR